MYRCLYSAYWLQAPARCWPALALASPHERVNVTLTTGAAPTVQPTRARRERSSSRNGNCSDRTTHARAERALNCRAGATAPALSRGFLPFLTLSL
jgi:hypothetical protein